ncbi:MAG: hypothetical protein WBA57_04500 [Elainellaceae cyanobacterium]
MKIAQMNRVITPAVLNPSRIFASVLCAASTWAIAEALLLPPASAQSLAQSLAQCPAAMAGEYLLLINNPSPEEQNRLGQVLPTGATVIECDYQGETVVQVGNFADEDLARSWAEYLSTVEGFQTAVALPPGEADVPTATPVASPEVASPEVTSPEDLDASASPASSGSTANAAYNPTVLEPGYAILVRYFNRPELATQLQSQLNASVGLAVYEQQPYLLVFYSPDAATAGQVLQRLGQQFSVVMVDSRQVVVLSSTVSVAEPTAERGDSQ